MARNLPVNIITEANELDSKGAWLVLLDITLPDSTQLYLVKNTENITYNGQEYTATEFNLSLNSSKGKGQLPQLTLSIENVTHVLESYIEATNGGVGSTVVLRVVNSEHLTENYSELEMTFTVVGTQVNANYVSWQLGIVSPTLMRFPLYKYNPLMCGYKFKSARCGYTGTDTTCDRTLDACRQKGNSKRFGGYVGLHNPAYSLRIVGF